MNKKHLGLLLVLTLSLSMGCLQETVLPSHEAHEDGSGLVLEDDTLREWLHGDDEG
ncbi:MAG: hypothetical protein GY822_29060 [Deltaproteobacteria bacterium]|nr:hypothetical protein [Deltaproteobacteria bacterium]